MLFARNPLDLHSLRRRMVGNGNRGDDLCPPAADAARGRRAQRADFGAMSRLWPEAIRRTPDSTPVPLDDWCLIDAAIRRWGKSNSLADR